MSGFCTLLLSVSMSKFQRSKTCIQAPRQEYSHPHTPTHTSHMTAYETRQRKCSAYDACVICPLLRTAYRLGFEGGDDENELLHRARIQPLGQLCQNLLQVFLESRVARDQHLQPVLANARKALWRVDAALRMWTHAHGLWVSARCTAWQGAERQAPGAGAHMPVAELAAYMNH